MRILIIGAGATGRNLAVKLCEMKHDVVLLDHSDAALAELEARVDVQTFTGEGSSPVILEKAGISKTDLVLAVTNQDEVNILACMYAHVAGVGSKVARVSNVDYLASSRWNWKANGIDLLVSQNEECAREVHDILTNVGAVDVLYMLDGRIVSAGIRVAENSPLNGETLEAVGKKHRELDRARFIALMRDEKMTVPHGDALLQSGDDAYFMSNSADIDNLLSWAVPDRPRLRRHIIAGGGGVGATLAKRMEDKGFDVILVESNEERAETVSESLSRTLVIKGDVSKKETLMECGISAGYSFTALTGDDELNIVSCVLAKKLGAEWTVAQVGEPEYVPIIRHMQMLDHVVSPYTIMINVILRFVCDSNIRSAAIFNSLPGELLEVELSEKSKWCGRTLKRMPLPSSALAALVQREDDVFIPGGDFALRAGDRLAVFVKLDQANRVMSLLKK